MATAKPTLVIPTNYAIPQQQIASRRKLAETMLGQGLAPDNNMTNWAQVLGKLGQTWAGKSMQGEADRKEGELNQQILGDYNGKRGQFLSDAKGMNVADLVAKYGNDPMLVEELKPYLEAMSAGLREREKLIDHNGRAGVRLGDVMGQPDNDPNKMVHLQPDGTMGLNPVAVTAAGISQGNLTPTDGYQSSAPMPGADRLRQAMMNPQPVPSPEDGVIPGVAGIVNGQKYWIINGKAYDNPEGR